MYYLRFCLPGLLNKQYIDHFQLLSAGIYKLLKDKISYEEIDEAERDLNKYADQFEEFYGKNNITMNIHLLRHLANAVRNLGPLWAQSSFALEANNGILTKTAAKHSILHSITFKYNVRCVQSEQTIKDESILLKRRANVRLTSSEQSALGQFGFHSIDSILIYDRAIFKKNEYKSLKSKIISTVDYFVQLKNGEIGSIEFFFFIRWY